MDYRSYSVLVLELGFGIFYVGVRERKIWSFSMLCGIVTYHTKDQLVFWDKICPMRKQKMLRCSKFTDVQHLKS